MKTYNKFVTNANTKREEKLTAIIWSLTWILPSMSAMLPSVIPLTNIRGFPSAQENTAPPF